MSFRSTSGIQARSSPMCCRAPSAWCSRTARKSASSAMRLRISTVRWAASTCLPARPRRVCWPYVRMCPCAAWTWPRPRGAEAELLRPARDVRDDGVGHFAVRDVAASLQYDRLCASQCLHALRVRERPVFVIVAMQRQHGATHRAQAVVEPPVGKTWRQPGIGPRAEYPWRFLAMVFLQAIDLAGLCEVAARLPDAGQRMFF